jgi:N-acetylglucosaminyldiphosphoundecaprenol N-acetyl-beta-D-mannosaminyltransferase
MKEYLSNLYTGSKESYYNYLLDLLHDESKEFIITVNPETIMTAYKNDTIASILLDKSNSLVPDGIAVVKKARQLGIPVKERITGVDISEYLLQKGNDLYKSIFLYGAKEEVVSDLVKVINKKYPNLDVLGYSNGYIEDQDQVFEIIKNLKPDICLVALGIPNQELIINKHLKEFSKGIFIGVGGTFDVLSGHKKRAPKIFIKCHLEWLYRLIKEPKRLKRFWQNNIKFMLKK